MWQCFLLSRCSGVWIRSWLRGSTSPLWTGSSATANTLGLWMSITTSTLLNLCRCVPRPRRSCRRRRTWLRSCSSLERWRIMKTTAAFVVAVLHGKHRPVLLRSFWPDYCSDRHRWQKQIKSPWKWPNWSKMTSCSRMVTLLMTGNISSFRALSQISSLLIWSVLKHHDFKHLI